MAESKVKAENFILVQGWMVSDLKLKGNELLIYAIIYGFSQDGENRFTGSLGYLAEWTNTTKQSVINALKSLQEKGYIEKIEKVLNGVKFCEYYSKNLMGVFKNFDRGIQNSLTGGIQKSLTNNIDLYNKENKIEDNNIYAESIQNIIDYLNSKIGTNYKATNKKTRSLIAARMKEGFYEDQFIYVIDKKVEEWQGTEMEKYLRPETLFGTKFENYLNAKVSRSQARPQQPQRNSGGNIFMEIGREEGIF